MPASFTPMSFPLMNMEQASPVSSALANMLGQQQLRQQTTTSDLYPQILHAKMFSQEMTPLATMAQHPLAMLLSKGYRQAYLNATQSALQNINPSQGPINTPNLDTLNLRAGNLLGGLLNYGNPNTQASNFNLGGIGEGFAPANPSSTSGSTTTAPSQTTASNIKTGTWNGRKGSMDMNTGIFSFTDSD